MNNHTSVDINVLKEIKNRHVNELLKKRNVYGCSIGYKEINGESTEQLSIVCYVGIKKPLDLLNEKDIIPKTIEGIITDVQNLNADPSWESANHMFFPQSIVDRISQVFQNVLLPQTRNLVDAALGKPTSMDTVIPEVLGLGIPQDIVEPRLGMRVLKSGRTTGVTEGIICGIDATIIISYPGLGLTRFDEQIVATAMSEPGDSGSLVVNGEMNGVGLLFAGTGEFTFINSIHNVFDRLSIADFYREADPSILKKVREDYGQGKSRKEVWRPAPGGVSIGLASVNSAGTLGCYVVSRGEILMLTNAHVIVEAYAGAS